ncbi:peptidylprolyl isomerase [Salinibacterium hongtaonis]|uniref:peptidylprolyl isomerase n=2 Tax=Homoserinimonas hongtaonis TaxID=2079791 RepID=A0A2U1T3C8_9MICO|nr:peptidylprolyl isomerase [Salinibacterium hongtaonis]PWB98385.1 peptidylprolyl isomerase [Salinibacterium hongtaonis]
MVLGAIDRVGGQVATSRGSEKEARAARERLRVYNARQTVHENTVSRRKRDNVIAVIAGAVVVAIAVAAQVAFFSFGPGASSPDAAPSPSPSSSAPVEGKNVGDVPSPDLAEGRTWTGQLTLNDVALDIELDGAAAPQAVSAFIQGTEDGYFVGKTCHRLTNGGFFVLQCGSADGQGSTDTSFSFGPIENAPADDFYPAGTLAMARVGGDAFSNGRQFFIVYDDTTIPSDAAGGYTVLGKVTGGLDALRAAITDAGVVPGSAETDGSPVIPTTITGLTLN